MQVLVRVYQDVLRRLLVIMFDSSVLLYCNGEVGWIREGGRLDDHS